MKEDKPSFSNRVIKQYNSKEMLLQQMLELSMNREALKGILGSLRTSGVRIHPGFTQKITEQISQIDNDIKDLYREYCKEHFKPKD